MNLLALDTSGDACSAALVQDGGIRQRLETAPRRHGELILPMLDGLLVETGIGLHDLDAVAFGRGPGSFTGVRIAVAVAQGIAFGAGLPTAPVSTLAALAQGEYRRSGRRRVLAALDARIGEVYWGAFAVDEGGLMAPLGDELVCPPGEVPLPEGGGWWGVGAGWAAYTQALVERLGASLAGMSPEAACEAQDIAWIGAALVRTGKLVAPELAQPVYLRDRVTNRG